MLKNPPAMQGTASNAGDSSSIPWSGRFSGEGSSNSLQYSCLENPMDRGARQATVHGVSRVRHDLETKPPNHLLYSVYLRTFVLTETFR